MKAELEAEVARLEAELAAAKTKLEAFVAEVPVELHNLESSAWARIQGFFAKFFPAAPATITAPAAPPANDSPAA